METGSSRLDGCDWESAHDPDQRPIRVLFVDDDPEFAGCVAHQLELSGNVAVDTATSGPAGLAAVDETIDCVVCGYEGTSLNGIEFLEVLRERHPTLPFVLVAADGNEAVAARAAAAGVTGYVPGGFGSEPYQGLVERIERAVTSERDERQVERLQRRLRKLIDHSADLITVLQGDGTIAFQSPSAERVLGFEPTAMVGENAFDYVHPDDRRAVVQAFDRAIAADGLVEVEWRARTAEGGWCWLHSVGTDRLEDPDVNGFVVNHRDCSDDRRRERRLQEQRERMEDLEEVLVAEVETPLASATATLAGTVDGTTIRGPGRGGTTPIVDDAEALDQQLDCVHGRITAGLDAATGLTAAGVPVEDPVAVALPDVVRVARESLAADGLLPTEAVTLNVTATGAVLADERRLERFFEYVFRRCLDRRSEGEAPVESDVTIQVETIEGDVDRRGTETDHSVDDPAEHVDANQDRAGPSATGFVVVVDGGTRDAHSSASAGEDDGPDRSFPAAAGIAAAHEWSLDRTVGDDGAVRVTVTGVEWAKGP